MNWKLAELNIAKMMYDYDGPEMKGFVDALDSVDALADASPNLIHHLLLM